MIAYTTRDPGVGWSLHAINPDGSGDATLEADGYSQAWSPDGNKILFNRFPAYGSPDIWVVNSDGTGERQLTSGFPAWSASWSPDGTKIAYKVSAPDNAASGEIWTMNADGSNKQQITNDGRAKLDLAWGMTPSGSKIAYIGFGSNLTWGLFTMNPDGSDLQQATGVTGELAYTAGVIDWSPDGTKIVFSSYNEQIVYGCNGFGANADELWVYDFATNTVTDVTNTTTWQGPYEQEPAWSPDGTRIVYTAYTNSCVGGNAHYGWKGVYTMNATGGGVAELVQPQQGIDHESPTWQPCVAGTTKNCAAPPFPAAQTITFGSLPDKTFGDPDFAVSATASSGLPVSFAASGSCTVSGSLVHLTGAGSCTITASQSGNASYSPAPSVQQTFAVTKAGQTISFAALPDRTFGDPDFAVSATASSGLPVSFAASGSCTVSGSLVHLTGAGSCTITASQSGNASYSPAPSVQQTFAVAKAGQTISFAALPDRTYGDPDFTVNATASSALPVSFAAAGNCTVSATALVHLTGGGTCTLTATQAGNANYSPAPQVARTFSITRPLACVVPKLVGKKLAAAKRLIKRNHCRTGRVRHRYSNVAKKGIVISQRPRPHRRLRLNAKVNLTVGRGPKH